MSELRLSENGWIQEFLLSQPESGMGYQEIEICLKDGRVISNLRTINAEIIVITNERENFNEEDILRIALPNGHTDEIIKTFFDPHPGFLGAAIMLPATVKIAADKLNGKTMSLYEAAAMIRAATEGIVSVERDHISLMLKVPDNVTHIFRVIRFR